MPNAVMAVATGKALLLELGKGTQQGERWLSISKKEIEPSWLFFPIKRLRTSRTRLSKWRQNQKKVRLWVKTLAKSCPSLRQRFCLLGCWRAACTEGLQEPHMHGATFACQSRQPASMGREQRWSSSCLWWRWALGAKCICNLGHGCMCRSSPGTAQPCAVILVHLLLCRMGQAPSWALLVSRCLELQELSSLGLLSVP